MLYIARWQPLPFTPQPRPTLTTTIPPDGRYDANYDYVLILFLNIF